MNTIGSKIHALRKNKCLTQAQLAEVLNVTPQTVSKWEKDQSAPDLSLLPAIARFFGITMDELFGYRLNALNRKERFIRLLADNGALRFGSFSLRCGRTSPYYISTERFHSASQLTRLGESYAECMRDQNVETNLLLANTERELPLMLAANAALYQRYGQDACYATGSAVGKPVTPEDRITLIKDTLTTGQSLAEHLSALHAKGATVTDIVVSVDRMEADDHSRLTARERLEKTYGVRIHAIVTLDDIIRAIQGGVIGGRSIWMRCCSTRQDTEGKNMVIDRLVEAIVQKRNPCIVGIDPKWSKLPLVYQALSENRAECFRLWACDVIDAVHDIVPAVKPQMAFFEVLSWEGLQVHQQVVEYAHGKGLLVIDDSKRNDIGNTAAAYAYAHLSKDGPINADFLTVNPFLGSDSIAPFIKTAQQHGKGLFVLVKTSNPSSGELSKAITPSGETVCEWLAQLVRHSGNGLMGRYSYSSIGAVVGATHPDEAGKLRSIMKEQFFLVPGYGAQGGSAASITGCFHPDGLGAVVSSSRGILYHYMQSETPQPDRQAYQEDVRQQARLMQEQIYDALTAAYGRLAY